MRPTVTAALQLVKQSIKDEVFAATRNAEAHELLETFLEDLHTSKTYAAARPEERSW